MKTRSYFILMAIVILVPTAIFAWIGLDNLLERERNTRIEAMQETARATSLAIDQEIARAEGALLVLANSAYVQTDDFASLYQLMEKGARTTNSWTVLFDYDGNFLTNMVAPFGTTFPPVGYTWVKTEIDTQKSTVSNVRIGKISKVPVISVNVPVSPSLGKQYLLAQIFRADHFNQFLNAPALSASSLVTVFGSDGVNIARNKEFDNRVGKPVPSDIYQASLKHPQGLQRYLTQNVEVYGAFTHTKRTGWTVSVGVPVSEIDGAANRAAWYTASIIGMIFAACMLVIMFLARRLTQSINEAVLSARALGQGATPALKEFKVDELNVLQKALHDAGTALEGENKARLVLTKEREQLLQNEQEARKQAEHQNKTKDEFLAMLAHELRNPLAPISAAAQLLKIAGNNEQFVQKSSEIIDRQVNHMTELINDLLDVSRVTRGLVQLHKEDIDLKEAVASAIEQTRPLIEERNHELTINMPSVPAYVHGDRTRLTQVISNLLNNAAKYTQQGGHIVLALEVDETQVKVSVTDNGSGIEPSLLPNIFDTFTQATRTSDRSQGGLGLGLTLVKGIMQIHEGQVKAHSEGLGKGSTFTLILPAINKAPTTTFEAQAPSQVGQSAKPLSILIVDDNRDAAHMLAVLLEAQGHQVAVEENPISALETAAAYPPKVFILDIGLPEIDGYELARRLRAQSATSNALFIALTGYGQEHDKTLSKYAGFDHHFVKPMDAQRLNKILAEAA